MEIKSLYCACNGRYDNPLDHYKSGACTKYPTLLGWIQSILNEQVSDEIHRDLTITTTRLTQSCAREVMITDSVPMEGFDWRRANSIHWGNIVHADMHANAAPNVYSEVLIPAPGKEPALVLGLPLKGRLDCVAGDMSWVSDYKTHGEMKQRKVTNNPPDREVVAQISVYGYMLQKNYGVPYPKLFLTHGAMVSAGSEPWYLPEVQPMTEEEILDMHPFNGQYTVRDRVAEYKQFIADREAGMSLHDAIKKMSLMGRSIWRGDKCLKYCFAKKYCDEVEGIVAI